MDEKPYAAATMNLKGHSTPLLPDSKLKECHERQHLSMSSYIVCVCAYVHGNNLKALYIASS